MKTLACSALLLTLAGIFGPNLYAEERAPVQWKKSDAGIFAWDEQANWSSVVPNGKGASVEFKLPAQGRAAVTLKQAVTLSNLNVGESEGKAENSMLIFDGTPLTFENENGAPTNVTLTQGSVPVGTKLNFAAGIKLGGTSPLTLRVNSPAAFDCMLKNVDLNGNTLTLEGARRWFPGDKWFGVNWQIGTLTGAGNFVQNGSGSAIGDAENFIGTFEVNNGDCKVARLPNVSQYILGGAFMKKHKFPSGGTLNLGGGKATPGKTTWSNRLNPSATLVFQGGGNLILNGQDLDEMAFFGQLRPQVVEKVKQIKFECGLSEMTVENGNQVSACTTLQATDPQNALVREPGGVVMLSGDGIRTTQGYWSALGMAEKILFASGMEKHLKGANGPAGSKNRSIIPWMTVGTVYHPAEGCWATYDKDKGVYSLLEFEEYDDKITGTPDRNVRTDNVNLGANQTQTVNSLFFPGWGNSDIGAGSTLNITSGALMITSMGGSSISATPAQAGTINFGAAEGVIWSPFVTLPGKDAKIGAVLAGSGGITKSGTSVLVLTAANTYTGRTCIAAGTIQVGDGKVSESKLGAGDLEIASGAVLSIKANVANAISDSATIILHHAGTAFYGSIELDQSINETVAGLVLDGKAQPAGTYGSKESAAKFKMDNYFSGPGILTVTGQAATKALTLNR